jgi:heme/copper-type cytochrome/quinol oxidase subunit 4
MADAPDVQKHEPAARYTDTPGKYIVIYLCILALATVQFVIAYGHADVTSRFARMFFVALAEAGLALMFFMHLWAEKRGFLLFVVIYTGFVLAVMQYGWTDSYRMELGVPNSQPKTGAVQE